MLLQRQNIILQFVGLEFHICHELPKPFSILFPENIKSLGFMSDPFCFDRRILSKVICEDVYEGRIGRAAAYFKVYGQLSVHMSAKQSNFYYCRFKGLKVKFII
jgi:hypothetical protein